MTPLDPRFAVIVDRLANAHPDSRAGMRRHAERIAAGCGRTYAAALAELEDAQRRAGDSHAATYACALPTYQETSKSPSTAGFAAFGAVSQRVVGCLLADPTRGVRAIAREVGCSATLVTRARRRLGLPDPGACL